MLILRTSNSDGTSYNGFQWPKNGPVEAPDGDPAPKCGKGLHGLLNGRGALYQLNWSPEALWQVVEIQEYMDLANKVKFPSGNVIYSGDMNGALEIISGDLSIREWVCEDPYWAYKYALEVDKTPRDDTRAAASKDPEWAYRYALEVDKAPRDDTRASASKNPLWAYRYALNVTKKVG